MSKALSLYTMTDDFKKYMESETDEEMASALADITAGQIEVKAQSYCQLIASLEGFSDQCKAEADRISKAAKFAKNKADRIKEHMKECLINADIMSLQSGTFKVTLQNNPPALSELNRDECPASYRVIIPETWEADKARIKEALKAGESVPGYDLTVGKSLRIK